LEAAPVERMRTPAAVAIPRAGKIFCAADTRNRRSTARRRETDDQISARKTTEANLRVRVMQGRRLVRVPINVSET
jgi:hypothetical protein